MVSVVPRLSSAAAFFPEPLMPLRIRTLLPSPRCVAALCWGQGSGWERRLFLRPVQWAQAAVSERDLPNKTGSAAPGPHPLSARTRNRVGSYVSEHLPHAERAARAPWPVSHGHPACEEVMFSHVTGERKACRGRVPGPRSVSW